MFVQSFKIGYHHEDIGCDLWTIDIAIKPLFFKFIDLVCFSGCIKLCWLRSIKVGVNKRLEVNDAPVGHANL
jgi:hypothetical protein